MSTREEQTRQAIKLLRRWVGEEEIAMVREQSVNVSFAFEPGFVYVSYDTQDWIGTTTRHTQTVQGERALVIVKAMCGDWNEKGAEDLFTPPPITNFPAREGESCR